MPTKFILDDLLFCMFDFGQTDEVMNDLKREK